MATGQGAASLQRQWRRFRPEGEGEGVFDTERRRIRERVQNQDSSSLTID